MGASARALVQTTKLADRPLNAILLQADIHTFFDDYQWSVLVCRVHAFFHLLKLFID
jgi:hypothetical protein